MRLTLCYSELKQRHYQYICSLQKQQRHILCMHLPYVCALAVSDLYRYQQFSASLTSSSFHSRSPIHLLPLPPMVVVVVVVVVVAVVVAVLVAAVFSSVL